MKRTILKLSALGLLATAIVVAPVQGFAQEQKKDAAAEKQDAASGKKKKGEGLPYRGKVSAIDKSAKTVAVGERKFHINSETRITKGGKPATLDDGVVGDEASFYYKKGDDGKLIALSVRFGPRPEGEAKGKSEKKGQKKAATE